MYHLYLSLKTLDTTESSCCEEGVAVILCLFTVGFQGNLMFLEQLASCPTHSAPSARHVIRTEQHASVNDSNSLLLQQSETPENYQSLVNPDQQRMETQLSLRIPRFILSSKSKVIYFIICIRLWWAVMSNMCRNLFFIPKNILQGRVARENMVKYKSTDNHLKKHKL